jgi:hypothetical protein
MLDASHVSTSRDLDEATTYTFFGWAKNTAGIEQNSADASATTVQNIPDSPDISLNDVSFTSMTVHMETVYAADKNVTGFRRFLEPHDGAMDSSDASMSTSLVWTKLQHILSMAGQKFAGIRNSADASATGTEYSDSPDISLNDVSFTDCAHGDGLRCRQECYSFRRFLDSA